MIASAGRRSRCASSVSSQRTRLALRSGCSAHPAGIVFAAALVGALIEVHDLGWAATPIVAAFPFAAGALAVPTAAERHSR
jgi:hypothetical protein